MKWIATSIAAGALTLGALPALAGGAVIKPAPTPAPAPVVKAAPAEGAWGGFSGGVGLGYANISYAGASGSGMTYGIQGAYDYSFGSWLVGVTGSWDVASITVGPDKVQRIGRIGLRAGPDYGKAYPYVTAGAATVSVNMAGPIVQHGGWFAGFGLDYKVAPNWSVGGLLATNQFKNFGGSNMSATTLSVNASYRF